MFKTTAHANRYADRIWPAEFVNTRGHFLLGEIWPVTGSTGNLYEVTMHAKGFSCNCPAIKGKCKHIKAIDAKFADAFDRDEEGSI